MLLRSFEARKLSTVLCMEIPKSFAVSIRDGSRSIVAHLSAAAYPELQDIPFGSDFNILVYETERGLKLKVTERRDIVTYKAGLFLFNRGTGQFLVVHSSGNLDRRFTIPKGNIEESDSDPVHTAYREFAEETGIVFSSTTEQDSLFPIGVTTYGKDILRYMIGFLKVINEKENPAVKLCWENDEFQWIRLSEARNFLYNSQLGFVKSVDSILKERYH